MIVCQGYGFEPELAFTCIAPHVYVHVRHQRIAYRVHPAPRGSTPGTELANQRDNGSVQTDYRAQEYSPPNKEKTSLISKRLLDSYVERAKTLLHGMSEFGYVATDGVDAIDHSGKLLARVVAMCFLELALQMW